MRSALLLLIVTLAITLTCVGLTSCRFGDVPPDPIRRRLYEEAIRQEGIRVTYATYSEEVVMPDRILENQAFEIAIRISAEAKRPVLLGYEHNHIVGVLPSDPIPAGSDYFIIARWPPLMLGNEDEPYYYELRLCILVLDPPMQGDPIDRFVFEVPGLPAGDHLISYSTARQRDMGGSLLAQTGEPGTFHPWDVEDPLLEKVEIWFTVRPDKEAD